MPERVKYTIVGLLGFLLSPLSWWNDAFVNIPLAYLFAIPFSLVSKSLHLPALILGYWLTNIIGLVLMHIGARKLSDGRMPPVEWKSTIAVGVGYTALIVGLALSGILKAPWEYLGKN